MKGEPRWQMLDPDKLEQCGLGCIQMEICLSGGFVSRDKGEANVHVPAMVYVSDVAGMAYLNGHPGWTRGTLVCRTNT